MYEFGEFTPDIPDLLNRGLSEAKNILPGERSYLPLPSVGAITDALTEDPKGGFTARDPDNTGLTYTYIGTETSIFELSGSTWSDVSGSTYATGSDNDWEFTQWGDQVVATNFDDNIQVATLGASFADLSGTPPQARHLAVIDNFLVVANTFDAIDGYQPQRVRWAGIGTITSWTSSSVTQASFNDLRNNGGFIQKIVGGNFGLIFQERAIVRMSYVGSPTVFQFDLLEQERGAYTSGSVIPVGNNVAFLAEDGFFVFDGAQSIPIGRGKIDNWFFSDLNIFYRSNMTGTNYPQQQILVWSYPSNDSGDGTPDSLLFYNYSPSAKTRWSYARVDHKLLLASLGQGYTLEELDNINTNIDLLPFSLDSPAYTGVIKNLAIIDTDLKLALFDGTAYDATIETGEFDLNQPKRTLITSVRPYIDGTGATVTIQIGGRNLTSETSTFGSTISLNSSGEAPVRNNNRFQKARIKITGDFDNAYGIDLIDSAEVGRR